MSIYAQYENFGLARLGLDIKTSISDAQKLKLSMMDYAKPFSPLVTCQLIKLLEESECNLGMREFCATLEDGKCAA